MMESEWIQHKSAAKGIAPMRRAARTSRRVRARSSARISAPGKRTRCEQYRGPQQSVERNGSGGTAHSSACLISGPEQAAAITAKSSARPTCGRFTGCAPSESPQWPGRWADTRPHSFRHCGNIGQSPGRAPADPDSPARCRWAGGCARACPSRPGG